MCMKEQGKLMLPALTCTLSLVTKKARSNIADPRIKEALKLTTSPTPVHAIQATSTEITNMSLIFVLSFYLNYSRVLGYVKEYRRMCISPILISRKNFCKPELMFILTIV
jgi:hypothetical protein